MLLIILVLSEKYTFTISSNDIVTLYKIEDLIAFQISLQSISF